MLKSPRYTELELMARMKFIVGLSLAFTLIGIVFVVLYSLIFVTQPMSQSPNDAKFFELITPIATFLTGILSGIMLGKSEDKKQEEPKKDEPLELSPQDLVPEPSAGATEVAPLVVAGVVGVAAVAAADDDEDQIA
jgi:hypothetical protein